MAFAHRGGGKEAPENSWAAFENARSLGYRHMETDVRCTADGVAIALHDPGLHRVAGRPVLLAQLSSTELGTCALGDGRPPPRLEDLLAWAPEVTWNIDMKEDGVVGPTVEAVRRAGARDRVVLTSFSGRRSARAAAALGGAVAVGAGRVAVASLWATAQLGGLPGWPGRAVAAQVPLKQGRLAVVTPRFVGACHRAGLAVHVWTVDRADQMHGLLDMGVDGIMTDRPSVLRAVLSERGQWPAER